MCVCVWRGGHSLSAPRDSSNLGASISSAIRLAPTFKSTFIIAIAIHLAVVVSLITGVVANFRISFSFSSSSSSSSHYYYYYALLAPLKVPWQQWVK